LTERDGLCVCVCVYSFYTNPEIKINYFCKLHQLILLLYNKCFSCEVQNEYVNCQTNELNSSEGQYSYRSLYTSMIRGMDGLSVCLYSCHLQNR
jgi:hypothetical protein